MPAVKTYTQYLAELSDMVDATGDPTLSSTQLERVLKNNRLAGPLGYPPDDYTNWAPNTVIAAGSYIVPIVRDGYVYYSALGGTTGAAEPSVWGASTIDNTVTWTRYGYAPWQGYYDLNRAAAEGWRLKAARAAPRKDVDAFGQRNHRVSTYEHCMEQAALYEGKIVDTVTVSSAARRVIY